MTVSRKTVFILSILIVLGFGGTVWGQSRIPVGSGYLGVTGSSGQGDQDRFMVAFFEVPDTVTGPIYFAIESPGMEDGDLVTTSRVNGDNAWDEAAASYSFHLLGGSGTLSSPNARNRTFANLSAASTGATTLATLTSTTHFPINAAGWYTFPPVYANQGEKIGNKFYFKVIAEAPSGSMAKNGFRLDASYSALSGVGTPSPITSIRAFAFTWTLQLINGISYNLFPFVPDTATGNLMTMNFDMDGGGTLALRNISNVDQAVPPVSGNNLESNRATSAYSIGTERNGTWRLQVNDGGAGTLDGLNMTEFWFEGDYNGNTAFDAGDEYLRAYSQAYPAVTPNRTTLNPATQTVLAGAPADAWITMQIVDTEGNPAPFSRNVRVEASGTASPTVNGVAASQVIRTNADGLASFFVRQSGVGLVTITLVTDGTGGSDDFGAGTDDTATIDYIADPLPSVSSASNTTFVENAPSPQNIAVITLTDLGIANITDANNLRIILPAGLGALFDNSVPSVTVSGANAGTWNVAYADANRTAIIDVPGAFVVGSTSFAGLRLASPYTVSSGSLGISWDGNSIPDAFDDKVITITSQYTTYVWNGAGTDWSTATNWTPNGVPDTNTEDAYIPFLGVAANYPVLPDVATTVRNITIESGASVTLAGGDLSISGTIQNNGTLIIAGAGRPDKMDTDSGLVRYTVAGGTITDFGANDYFNLELTGTGVFSLSGQYKGNGTINVESNAVLDLAAWDVANSGIITNAGRIRLNGNAQAFPTGNLVSNVASVIEYYGGMGTFTAGASYARLEITGGSRTAGADLSVSETVLVSLGAVFDLSTRALTGATGFTNNGSVRISGGGQTVAGVKTNGSSSTVEYYGTGAGLAWGNAYHHLSIAGADTFSAAAALTVAGNLTLSSGTLNAAANDVSVAGDFARTTGALSSSGTVTFNGAGAQAFDPTSSTFANITVNKSGGTLTLGGSLTLSGNLTRTAGNLAMGANALSVAGDIVYASGTLSSTGMVTLNGSAAAQNVNFTNATLTSLTLNNTFGTPTITAGSAISLSGTLTRTAGNLDMGANPLTVAGDIIYASGMLSSTGTVTLSGSAAAQNVNFTNATLTNLTLNNTFSTPTITAGSAIYLSGNLTRTAGNLVMDAHELTVAGNVSYTAGTLSSTGMVTLNGSAAAQNVNFTNTTLMNLTLNNSFGTPTITAGSAISLSGTLTRTAGNLDMGANPLTVAGDIIYASGMLSSTGTVMLNGSAAAQNVNFTNATLVNLVLNNTFGTPMITASGPIALGGNLTRTAGNLVMGANALTVAGNITYSAGTLTSTGTVTLSGSAAGQAIDFTDSALANLVLSNTFVTPTITVGSPIALSGNLTRTAGNLVMGAHDLTVAGNITYTAGSLSSTGTVTLNGTSAGQTVNFTNAILANLVLNNTFGTPTITATGPITLSGSLTRTTGNLVMGTHDLTVAGNITYTAGSLSSMGTVTLNSAGAQSVDFTGSTIATLAAANTGAGVISTAASLSAANFIKTNTGSFSLGAGHTFTVSTAFTASAGTVALNGPYAGGGATFTVNGAAITVAANTFAAGAMTVSSGSFTQNGVNGGAQTAASIIVSGTGSCIWDNPATGGTLAVSGGVTVMAGTLNFNRKAVTVGTTITGLVTFYDLVIPVGVTLTPGASTTITVLRNLTVQNTGAYNAVNSPTLILGGASGLAGNISDFNGTPTNLGTLVIDTQAKTLLSSIAATTLDIRNGGILAAAGYTATITGAATTSAGAGTFSASTGGIVAGGNLSVTTLTFTGAGNATVGGNFAPGAFTASTSTVTLNGAAAAGISAGYIFNNLTINKDADGNTVTPAGLVTVDGTLNLTRGTWMAGANTLILTMGNWNSSSANFTFTQGTSTVRLDEAAPTVSQKGADRFYNLTFQQGGFLGSDVAVDNNFTAAGAGGGGTLTLGANVLYAGGAVNLRPGATGATLVSTGSTLSLNGSGDQTVTSSGQAWNNLTVGNRTAATTVTFTDSFSVNGTWTVTGPNAYNVTLSAPGSAANNVDFANAGTLTIAAGFTFGDGATATAGPKSLAGTISATGASNLDFGTTATTISGNATLATSGAGTVTLAAVTVNDGFTLTLGIGAATTVGTGAISGIGGAPASNLTIDTTGVVTIGGAVGTDIGTVTVTQSGGATFLSTVNAATVTLNETAAGQTIAFNGALTVTTGMSAAAGGFNVALNQGGGAQTSTIAGNTTLANTGTLTLGNDVGDVVNFTGGLTATAQSAKTIYGTVAAAGTGVLNLGGAGAVTIAATSTIGGTSTGQITLGTVNITGGGATLTLGAGAATPIAAGAIGAAAVGNLTVNTTAGAGSTIASYMPTNASTLTITNIGTGGLTFGGAVGTVGTPLASLLFAPTIVSTGTVTFAGALYATAATVNAGTGAYGIALNGGGTISGAVTFENTGPLTVGAGFTFTNGATKTTAGVKSFAGTISSTDADLNFGAAGTVSMPANATFSPGTGTVTLIATTISAGATLTLGTGAATTVITGAIDGAATSALTINTTGGATIGGAVGTTAMGTVTVTQSGGTGTTFQNAVNAATVTLTDTTGTIAFNGNLTATTLNVAAAGFELSMSGAVNSVTGAVNFQNTGGLTLGDAAGDSFIFTGGLSSTTAGANTFQGTVSTGGAVGQDITLDDLTVGAGGVTFITGDGTAGTGRLVISGIATVPAGLTLDVGSSNFSINTLSSGIPATAGIFRLRGVQTEHVFGTFDTDSGVVEYYGAAAGTVFSTGFGGAGNEYFDLRIAAGAGTKMLDGAIIVLNDLHIAGGVLDVNAAGNYQITVAGNWQNDVGFGGFAARAGTVNFNPPSGTIQVRGSNSWYAFECVVPGIIIEFENGFPAITQRIISGGTFRVQGTAISRARLDRIYDTVIPGNPPNIPLDDNKFWFFDLTPGATLDLDFVDIYYSNARSNPLSIPLVAGDPDRVVAVPYSTHFCFKWLDIAYAIYSYTEDSNYNGRIDRIRVTTETNINMSIGQFDGFVAEVTGYTVTGYSIPIDGRNFYIHLQEKPYLDSGATPDWTIISNTTLFDVGGKLIGTVSRADDFNPSTDESRMTPADTSWPIIGYTLTIPSHDGTFIHFSEPIVRAAGTSLDETDFGAVSFVRIPPTASPFTREALVGLGEFDTATVASSLTQVSVTPDSRDEGIAPYWEPAYAGQVIGYPAPTYPPATGYTANPNLYASYGPTPSAIGPILPTRPAFELQRGGMGLTSHRVSDLLVSVPPTPTVTGSWSANHIDSWFVWPIWARDEGYNPGDVNDFGDFASMNPNDFSSLTVGLIRAFDGSQWLRDQNFLIQSRTNPASTLDSPVIWYDSDVGSDYLGTSSGIWLPADSDNIFFGLTARIRTGVSDNASTLPQPGIDLWNHNFLASDSKIYDRAKFEFFYRLSGVPSAPYAARLDMAPGAPALPPDWYRRVRPFGFSIRELLTQRSGVTILNNVIDPTKGERTRLNYILSSAGQVTITVFTLDGDVVQVLQRGRQNPGDYTVNWDGRNRAGNSVARGIYFIRIVAPGIDEIRKVMVVKD